MEGNDMSELKDDIAGAIASRFNWQAWAVRAGITAAIAIGGFAIDKLRTKAAFDRGWASYETKLREGIAKLDGQQVKIITDAEQQALIDQAKIKGEAKGFQDAQIQFTETLRGIHAQHSRDLARLATRELTQEEIDWRSGLIPNSTGLRLNRIISARESGYSQSGLSTTGNRADATGYQADYSGEPNTDERQP